ncbi:MAG: hypothetical protein ACI4PP_08010 [Clostridia bacterium]
MTPSKGRDLTAVSRGGRRACPDTIWFAPFADTEIRNGAVSDGIFVRFGNAEREQPAE